MIPEITIKWSVMQAADRHLLTVADVARRLPRRASGRPVAERTIRHWMTAGLRGVRLESTCVGGRRYVPLDELLAFLEETQQPAATSRAAADRIQELDRFHRQRRAVAMLKRSYRI